MMPPNDASTAWLTSDAAGPCRVEGLDEAVASQIWFKSKPVDRDFCYRVTQLQLCTDSHDQGALAKMDGVMGSWTWFEVVILPDEQATVPRKSKYGKELAWRSHNNKLGSAGPTRHFGAVFDRRSELMANFEIGDVLAVRVCARYAQRVNNAQKGFIVARTLNEDLFTPYAWTLASESRPSDATTEDGCYSFMSTTTCVVESTDNNLHTKIWFTTPALDRDTIDRLESVQLFTQSRFQRTLKGSIRDGDSFSWFDLVILESPNDTKPKVKDGVSLVWLSHANMSGKIDPLGSQGQLFDEEVTNQQRCGEIKQIKAALEPGNMIGVRVCAQLPGWENYAELGQLVVRISNTGYAQKELTIPNLVSANNAYAQVQSAISSFYRDLSAETVDKPGPAFQSATVMMLASEARADQLVSSGPPPVKQRPLRLLSVDGGGVRGVSSLRILKRIMAKVSELEGRAVQPYEYFDLIAGTSTGGLIALMLGRLRMSIDQCEQEYKVISQKVFGKKNPIFSDQGSAFVTNSHLYEAKPLEDAIKDVVGRILKDPEAPLFDSSANASQCRAFVMSALASHVEDGNTAVHLRTYDPGPTVPSEYSGWHIWQAARATSAAPVYFDRFSYNGQDFVDGGLGWNNPVLELIADVPAVFGKDRTIGCLLSLGTGVPPDLKLDTGLSSIPDFIDIATNSERAHRQVEKFAPLLPVSGDQKYWRFNLSKQLSDKDWVMKTVSDGGFLGTGIGAKTSEKQVGYEDVMVKMDDWQGIGLMQELTDKWLDRVGDDVLKCAKKLCMRV